jgi:hypothetical protein
MNMSRHLKLRFQHLRIAAAGGLLVAIACHWSTPRAWAFDGEPAAAVPVAAEPAAVAADPLADVAEVRVPATAPVREQLFAYLAARQAPPEVLKQAETLWPAAEGELSGSILLDRLVACLALVDARVQTLAAQCTQPRTQVLLPDQSWLADEQLPVWVRNNLRLYYGRWLVQERLYDEALLQLNGLHATDVVDPASLLFFQGVTHHRLLNKTDGLKAIETLLNKMIDGPARYVALARLMQDDLSRLEDDSLDHIARRMDDVKRRLELGRAGKKVRTLEDGVVKSLDKLIEEMEEQQKKQQQQQANGSSGTPGNPSAPMQESRIATANGKGETDRRDIGDSAGWGDLPAKEREAALQQIGKDFPAHYRDVIEQYFRKLASEGSERQGQR